MIGFDGKVQIFGLRDFNFQRGQNAMQEETVSADFSEKWMKGSGMKPYLAEFVNFLRLKVFRELRQDDALKSGSKSWNSLDFGLFEHFRRQGKLKILWDEFRSSFPDQ